MKKITSILMAVLFAVWGAANIQAETTVPEGETDVTTLTWVDNGQGCTKDFNNENGSTVYGTDAGNGNLSYVDLSAYGTIKLYGTANQTARLFINREEAGDNGIFFVDLNEEGVATFDCNTIFTKQPKAQYIHLNGVKASAYNTTLNLSLITASGDPLTFPEIFIFPEGETDLTTLPWVNEGQDCTNNLGKETGDTNYGTDAGPADGKLSYVDITKYATIKLYGRAGDVARLFINRAEFSDNFQFYVTIGEDGVGALNLADVYTTQTGAEYVHLNGIKATWGGKAQVNAISLIEKPSPNTITASFWHEWSATDATATITKEVCDGIVVELNKPQGNGSVFAGYSWNMFPGNTYADLSEYAGIYFKGTPGTPVRCMLNRPNMGNTGDITNCRGTLDANGELSLMFDSFTELVNAGYVHLNGVKIEGEAEAYVITAFNFIEKSEEPIEPEPVDPCAITPEMFFQWEGFDETNKWLNPTNPTATGCDYKLGEEIGQGSVFYGTGSVNGNQFADLSAYDGIYAEGTPEFVLRLLFNRPATGDGTISELQPTFNEDGEMYVLFTELAAAEVTKYGAAFPYVHLNAVKTPYNGKTGTVTKFNFIEKPSANSASKIQWTDADNNKFDGVMNLNKPLGLGEAFAGNMETIGNYLDLTGWGGFDIEGTPNKLLLFIFNYGDESLDEGFIYLPVYLNEEGKFRCNFYTDPQFSGVKYVHLHYAYVNDASMMDDDDATSKKYTVVNKFNMLSLETLGVSDVMVDAPCAADDAIYNIYGQRVDESYKGIVIKNGKKYINR